jgi:hypothetical protein
MEPLLGTDLTTRQVIELAVPGPVDAVLQDTCAILINFLTVTPVQPTDESAATLTAQAQADRARYGMGPVAINCRR